MAALRERLTPEQADFVRAVDAFCERECPPHKLRAMTANGTIAHDDASTGSWRPPAGSG